MTTPKCKCGKPAEWLDEYCQMCWEDYCSETWWQMMVRLEDVGLLEEVEEVK
jgi:hypothetical protein